MAYDLQLQHDIAEALDMADREEGFDSRRRSQSKLVSAPSEADLERRPAGLRNMKVKILSRTIARVVRAEVMAFFVFCLCVYLRVGFGRGAPCQLAEACLRPPTP